MMFASKTPRDLNSHVAFMTGAGTPPLCSCGWQGRRHDGPILAEHIAEFDHVQHNEPNPILTWHRNTTRHGMNAIAARYILDHWGATVGFVGSVHIIDYTPEHEIHARRVLTRLANL